MIAHLITVTIDANFVAINDWTTMTSKVWYRPAQSFFKVQL